MRRLVRVVLPVAAARAVKEGKRLARNFLAHYAEVRKERAE